jgi:hypothetical protein
MPKAWCKKNYSLPPKLLDSFDKNKNIKESMRNLQKCPTRNYPVLNKLSNELFYTQNEATSKKI